MQAERREGRREVEERRLRVHRRDTPRRSDYRREYPRRMIAVSSPTSVARGGIDEPIFAAVGSIGASRNRAAEARVA